ncbi:hypothetical protein F3Y22_tig00112507pilonHSYRG00083 [Hibiscus syriacus]|uniref:RNase H type-1 domain-containing protein n=1 Tax=Hibiscus syriacus TaxID=106335 RepID=A0A6A2WX43_HIBSY|nr:hypothetical protein F3Y22_tig00112507pilonHSYRG00083 [Hibiscus syriacus]
MSFGGLKDVTFKNIFVTFDPQNMSLDVSKMMPFEVPKETSFEVPRVVFVDIPSALPIVKRIQQPTPIKHPPWNLSYVHGIILPTNNGKILCGYKLDWYIELKYFKKFQRSWTFKEPIQELPVQEVPFHKELAKDSSSCNSPMTSSSSAHTHGKCMLEAKSRLIAAIFIPWTSRHYPMVATSPKPCKKTHPKLINSRTSVLVNPRSGHNKAIYSLPSKRVDSPYITVVPLAHLRKKRCSTYFATAPSRILFGPYLSPSQLLQIGVSWARYYHDSASHVDTNGCGSFELIQWQPPQSNWVCLNSDVARSLSLTSVIHVELWGVYDGLQFAWSKGFKKVLVQIDSTDVIELLSTPSLVSSFTFVRIIAVLCSKAWMVEFTAIRREANFAADHLAKLILIQDPSLIIIDHPPSYLLHILDRDLQGPRHARISI